MLKISSSSTCSLIDPSVTSVLSEPNVHLSTSTIRLVPLVGRTSKERRYVHYTEAVSNQAYASEIPDHEVGTEAAIDLCVH